MNLFHLFVATIALFQSAGVGVSAFAQPIPYHSTGHHRTSSFGSGTPQLQATPVSILSKVVQFYTYILQHRPRTHSNASTSSSGGRQQHQRPLQNT